MVFLSRLFPASSTARGASWISSRRRPKANSRVMAVAARTPSLAAESLEPRAMLAVTASLVGGDLVIAYNAAGDLVADIESDGTKYTVSGTGLAAKQFNVADVTGVITVTDNAAVGGQQFKVNVGTALANALQVDASVESTGLFGGIATGKTGDVLIGSSAISLASDISTAATGGNITLSGATSLTSPVSLSTGGGDGHITFSGPLDGNQALSLTAGTGNVTFSEALGSATRLGAIAIMSASDVTAKAIAAASLTQVAGSGTTTLNGDVDIHTIGEGVGLSLAGTNLVVNAEISVVFDAPVTFNQSGTITIASDGDILAWGDVTMTAAGGITTAGDIRTINGNETSGSVTFASKTMLSGPVEVDASHHRGNNVAFSSTVDGAHPLRLLGGGAISFAGKVGNVTPLTGLWILSAASTTFASTLSLDGAGEVGAGGGGLVIENGVDNVTLNIPGSTIKNFAGTGIVLGNDGTGSNNSTISGVTISNNGGGIRVRAGDHSGTVIAGNTIRDNGNSTTHEGSGILVEGSNLTIGWTAEAGAPNTVGNTITGNAKNGIEIRGAQAQNNTILSNSIYLNGYAASGVVVGDGIALVDGGNGALPSPRILGVVADAGSGTIRVQVVVPRAGSHYVQLFGNTPADERGIFPADTNGFEGRTYVGDSPAQASSAVTAGKPVIAGMLIAGNTVAVIQMPADRVPAGGWITATATAVEAGVAGGTSGFSEAVQRASVPALAVGSDGPAVWVPHYNYQALSGNVLRLGGLTVTEINRLVTMRGQRIFISADGRSDVGTATVANVLQVSATAVTMTLRNIASPGGSLAGTAGRLEPGPLTLPAARLYDAATGAVVLDVGAAAITASLQAAGVGPAAAAAFVSRFQGGLRVASGDVDGDGFTDLVTAPGTAPAIPAATFGNAGRIITIYSANPAAAWESVSFNVAGAFPGYSGGFQVTLGDVLPEVPGSGSGVLELIVAGTNKVAVYELSVPARGAAPVITATPAAEWTVGPRFRVTGLAAGDFSAAASDEVVVATAAPAGTVVRTFAVTGGNFAAQSTFRVQSFVQGDPQRRLRDVFANGAALAVGDIDGAVDGRQELVLAAAAEGLANFRVLANALVATGSQAAIDQALSLGNGFTRQSRSQYATVGGRRVWQPAGGPDYFAGIARLANSTARGINAPLSVAVVNATGATAAGQAFAALGPQNTTANMVRRLAWSSLETSWSGIDAFQVQPAGRPRFPAGGGLRLG